MLLLQTTGISLGHQCDNGLRVRLAPDKFDIIVPKMTGEPRGAFEVTRKVIKIETVPNVIMTQLTVRLR